MIQGNVSKNKTAAANCFAMATMPFEHAGSQYVSVLFVAQRDGLAPWPCQRWASERCMRTDCRGLKSFVSVRSRRDNMPTDGRDVPSVRISLQPLIIVCIPRTLSPYILPLFAHILSPLSVSVAISGH